MRSCPDELSTSYPQEEVKTWSLPSRFEDGRHFFISFYAKCMFHDQDHKYPRCVALPGLDDERGNSSSHR